MIYFLLLVSYLFSNNIVLLDSTNLRQDSQLIDSLNINNSIFDTIVLPNNNIIIDTVYLKTDLKDNIGDIFYEQLYDTKLTFADAIMYDISLDTIETEIQFRSLFDSFEFLDSLSLDDEYKRIEYNLILNASIDYYQNKTVTTSKLESPLSMALFKEKLEAYFYKQKLEDVEFVGETVEFIDGHIPITFNSKVSKIVKYFSGPEGKRGVQLWLNRISKFKKIILPILEEEGVPPEIFYVSVIESGLNPLALSYAQASGPWQFIASTGKVYGLNKSWYIDERRDLVKSTYAAARYLKDLKAIFDKENPEDKNGENWYLAFAAYNCGASRVLKEIKRSNSYNFWDLNRLPGQTRNYVPKILGIFLISKNPEKYGFTDSKDIDNDMKWITKEINKQVSFEQLSEITNLKIKTLQFYNPEIKRGIIPPLENGTTYKLKLPYNDYSNFDSLMTSLIEKNSKDLLVVEYVVRSNDNLSKIAQKYRVNWRDIYSMNNLTTTFIKPGQKLQIPTQGYDEYMKSLLTSNSTKKIYYTVKNGDTLSEISERFSTSLKKLKAWNGIRQQNDIIRIGRKLTIHVPNTYVDKKTQNNSQRKITYTVKRGDSLSKIGVRYRVSVKNIKKWNRLKGNTIKIKQKLTIYTKY